MAHGFALSAAVVLMCCAAATPTGGAPGVIFHSPQSGVAVSGRTFLIEVEVYVFVCVCVRERETERESVCGGVEVSKTERGSKSESKAEAWKGRWKAEREMARDDDG